MWQLALSVATILCNHDLVHLENIKPENHNYGANPEGLIPRSEGDEKRLLGEDSIVQCLKAETYAKAKGGKLLEERRRVKKEVQEMALKGWVKNEGGEGFASDWLSGGK